MTYAELSAHSAAAHSAGPTGVALFVEGGQGCPRQVFRVIRLPRESFAREILQRGDVSASLRAYARRKGLGLGFHPKNDFGALPLAWAHAAGPMHWISAAH